ncbi:MAG: NeuD/PglB/VioB family sugar acetyltransferase [Phycisphaerae bacterium]|nr:NeuD/PglB/VioB family sugar acetyltransferase [Phycisphaerae bacterium]
MASRELILLGAGGHATVVAESAVAAGWRIIGYCANESSRQAGCSALQAPWLGPIEAPTPDGVRLLNGSTKLHLAVGDARLREKWCARFPPDRLATIVHPGSWISPSASVAPGAYIGAFAVVNAAASIAIATIVNTAAIVEHGVKVGTCSHLAPRSTLAGLAHVGERVLIGAGAVVLPFVRVGNDAIVGAGSVVHRDVDNGLTVAGIPARELRARAASS